MNAGGNDGRRRPRRWRKLLAAAVLVGGFLLLLAAAAVALAPWWINLSAVRKRIERAASSAVGGEVTVGRVDLSWLPRPEVSVRELDVTIPGKVRAAVRSAGLSPVVLSLLGGRLRFASLRLDGADVTLDVPESRANEAAAAPAHPVQELTRLLGSLAPEAPALVAVVSDSRVAIVRGGASLADVRGVAARVAVTPKQARAVRADVGLSVSSISLRRPGRPAFEMGGLRVEGRLDSGEERAEGTLSHLSLETPRLSARLEVRAEGSGPQAELTATGDRLDVTALRQKLLAFARDDRLVRDIFTIVRGGALNSFSFSAKGRTPAELGNFERMTIRAVLTDGTIRIGSLGLDLEEARGDVSIEGGVLSAQNAAARIGKSQASDGSVRIALAGKERTLRVDARVRSDLSELPPILRRVVGSASFRNELSLVEGLSGSAVGRITIGDRAGALRTVVSVSEMRLSVRYGRLPWPVRIVSGGFFFDGGRVGVSRLSGTVGGTRLSGITARVRLADLPLFEEVSGRVEASLDELYPWLTSRDGLEALRTKIPRLGGSLGLDLARLSGPISWPQEWRGSAEGTLKDLILETSFLPEPVEVKTAGFRIYPETIGVTGLRARTMDADLEVSGHLDGYQRRDRKLEAVLDGSVGRKAVRWIWERASLPAHLLPSAPLAFRSLRLGLEGGDALSLAGSCVLHDGPRVTVDLSVDREETSLRRITFADDVSDATISFRRRGGEVEVGFDGHLEAGTIGELFENRRERRGRMEGDFHAVVQRGHIERTRAEGSLEAADIGIPTLAGLLRVERLGLRGGEGRLDVTSSSFLLGDQRFAVEGNASFRENGVLLDMDVAADDVSWERVGKILDGLSAGKAAAAEGANGGAAVPPPVRGDVRLSAGAFTLGNLTWAPVQADVRLEGDSVTATVRKAEACGISTTGELRLLPGGALCLDGEVNASGPDISVPLTCLGFDRLSLTGSYEARVKADASGRASELPRSLRGPLHFRSSKGKIAKSTVLTRVLTAVNVTAAFSGKRRDKVGEAMSYDELSADGELGEGRVNIREGALKSPAFAMAASGTIGYLDGTVDLMVLTHPLSTFDKVIQSIPVLRYILGKEFLSVAARVTGSLEDPKVAVTPARDASQGLVNILERTVKIPVKVFEPQ